MGTIFLVKINSKLKMNRETVLNIFSLIVSLVSMYSKFYTSFAILLYCAVVESKPSACLLEAVCMGEVRV